MANLPVTYMNQQNAWVDTTIFSLWFHDHFVPFVQKKLQKLKLPKKALVYLDNCSAHSDEELLVSKDKLVKAMFLPPNVTSSIQPMDQGVLECLKRHYKGSLLRDVLLSDETADLVVFLKSVTMKAVVEKISAAWDQIAALTIRGSWRKLLPLPQQESYTLPENDHTTFVQDFQLIGCDMSENEVEEWLASDKNDPGYAHLNDTEIADHVLRNNLSLEDEDESDNECNVIETSCYSYGYAGEMSGMA